MGAGDIALGIRIWEAGVAEFESESESFCEEEGATLLFARWGGAFGRRSW